MPKLQPNHAGFSPSGMLFEKFAHNAHVFCNLFRSLITSQKSSDHNGRSRGLQALKHKPEIKSALAAGHSFMPVYRANEYTILKWIEPGSPGTGHETTRSPCRPNPVTGLKCRHQHQPKPEHEGNAHDQDHSSTDSFNWSRNKEP